MKEDFLRQLKDEIAPLLNQLKSYESPAKKKKSREELERLLKNPYKKIQKVCSRHLQKEQRKGVHREKIKLDQKKIS